MWARIRSLIVPEENGGGRVGSEEEEEGGVTSDSSSHKQHAHHNGDDDDEDDRKKIQNPPRKEVCHFLRLPTELRLQIYSYTNLGGHTIEILHLPVSQHPFYDTKTCHPNSSSSAHPTTRQLLYRLETREQLTPKERCFSINGLFALTSVCRQTRMETALLIYKLNAFSFSDAHYNYASAVRVWTASLHSRELHAVRTLYWPLRQALVFQHSVHGVGMRDPDRACEEELRALSGLEKVVLRYSAADVGRRVGEFSVEERRVLDGLFGEADQAWDYAIEREFRRRLAVRGMVRLVGRDGVDVLCEKLRS
jgi:hypothetical protein